MDLFFKGLWYSHFVSCLIVYSRALALVQRNKLSSSRNEGELELGDYVTKDRGNCRTSVKCSE